MKDDLKKEIQGKVIEGLNKDFPLKNDVMPSADYLL